MQIRSFLHIERLETILSIRVLSLSESYHAFTLQDIQSKQKLLSGKNLIKNKMKTKAKTKKLQEARQICSGNIRKSKKMRIKKTGRGRQQNSSLQKRANMRRQRILPR